MNNIKWSIMIPSVPQRRQERRRVLIVLEPQLEKYDDIELLIFEDNRKRPFGEKLQSLVDISRGEYISFIDDDDLVSEKYVESIYPTLDGVDAVGFKGLISLNEDKTLPVYYSVQNKEPVNKPDGYYRFVQHLNPIRRDIVTQVSYEGHSGADIRWGNEILKRNLIQSENFIDDILYYYIASTTDGREIWDR